MEYSAGFTKEKWSENELSVVIPMLKEGQTKKEIFDKVADGNLFQLKSFIAVKNRFNMVYRRAASLDDELQVVFMNGTDFDKKALTLLTFLSVYRIPLEFYYEVILHKFSKGEPLYKVDYYDFFETKANQDSTVESWRPETVNRLIRTLSTFYTESALLKKVANNQYEITPIHLSQSLKDYAKDHEPLLYSFSQLEKGDQ